MDDLIQRRLLLAKEFYLHAAERSRQIDVVNKMMAIHNFHIAVEILLKAILLKYEIKTEKSLNISFDEMMSEIDKHTGSKLPYRQELRALNSLRNLVQHQASEPAQSSVDDYRAFIQRFLEAAYSIYFEVDFSRLSRVELVTDEFLRGLLICAQDCLRSNEPMEAAIRTLAAFQLASLSITSFLPDEGLNSSFFATAPLRHAPVDLGPLIGVVEGAYARIRTAEELTAVLSSGVSLSNLKRLKSLPLSLTFSVNGTPIVQRSDSALSSDEAAWAVEFTTTCILLWQQHGLDPKLPAPINDVSAKALLGPSHRLAYA